MNREEMQTKIDSLLEEVNTLRLQLDAERTRQANKRVHKLLYPAATESDLEIAYGSYSTFSQKRWS